MSQYYEIENVCFVLSRFSLSIPLGMMWVCQYHLCKMNNQGMLYGSLSQGRNIILMYNRKIYFQLNGYAKSRSIILH